MFHAGIPTSEKRYFPVQVASFRYPVVPVKLFLEFPVVLQYHLPGLSAKLPYRQNYHINPLVGPSLAFQRKALYSSSKEVPLH